MALTNAERQRRHRAKKRRAREEAERREAQALGNGATADPELGAGKQMGAVAEASLVRRLRGAKLVQETRKLKLENDLREGRQVSLAEVAARWSALGGAMRSALEAFPARLKMRRPDLSTEDMTAVRKELVTLSRTWADLYRREREAQGVTTGNDGDGDAA